MGCQVVLVVLQRQVDHLEGGSLAHYRLLVAVGHQVVQQVAAGRTGPENADRTVIGGGVVTGVLEGVPGGLQEKSLLRIHHPGSDWRHPEEISVELFDPVKQGRPPNIGGISQRFWRDPGRGQRLFGQGDYGLFATAQVVPERRHRPGTRESAGHTDHGDGVRRIADQGCVIGARGHPPCPFGLRCLAPWRARARCWARAPRPEAAAATATVDS